MHRYLALFAVQPQANPDNCDTTDYKLLRLVWKSAMLFQQRCRGNNYKDGSFCTACGSSKVDEPKRPVEELSIRIVPAGAAAYLRISW